MTEPSVTTVTGPIPASSLGVVNAHDHLFLRSPALAGQELEDPERAREEVAAGRASGIGSIVEMTPIGLGRRPELLRSVSEATGVPIVAASGYHRDTHYAADHWVHTASVDELAEPILRDLTEGMHPTDWTDASAPLDVARAGAIKAGTSYQHATPAERRRLEAAAVGSNRAGVAILVHTEVGTFGSEVVDLLLEAGVPADRVILSHMDRNPDLELHADLADRGIYLEYNTVGRIKYRPDSQLLELIEGMVAAGHGSRLMLGMDLGRREYHRAYGGGPGMQYLMDAFVPRLRRRLGDAATDAILRGNPARAFASAIA